MSVKPIPDGYHTITPAIIVRCAANAIEFYRKAFGAQVVERMDGPDGTVMHAEIRIGDSIVMLGDENPQFGTLSPMSTNGTSSSLHIYVDDVDAVFARAIGAGAKVKYPIENAFWGDRYGKVTDPFGHEWGIATHLKDMTPDEVRRAAGEWMQRMSQQAGSPPRHERVEA
jgi:PhnB protein